MSYREAPISRHYFSKGAYFDLEAIEAICWQGGNGLLLFRGGNKAELTASATKDVLAALATYLT